MYIPEYFTLGLNYMFERYFLFFFNMDYYLSLTSYQSQRSGYQAKRGTQRNSYE